MTSSSIALQPSARPFAAPGWLVFGVALAAGSVALAWDLRFALVASAVVFGWTQIGGL